MTAPPDPRKDATRRRWALAAALCLAALGRPALADHPNALWHVVHDLCVRDQKLTGLPAPCVAVNLKAGYAIVPDPGSPNQLLVVPTNRVTGIEDPQLLKPGAPNYWQIAWRTRALLAQRLGDAIPRWRFAMAINAVAGRSQSQLHIHLSCVRPDVAEGLRSLAPKLGERWTTVSVIGQVWRARALVGEDLGETDPFKLLADSDAQIAANMGAQTLVVVGAQLPNDTPGFYLLSRTADPATGYDGHGEFLLDKTCSAARMATP